MSTTIFMISTTSRAAAASSAKSFVFADTSNTNLISLAHVAEEVEAGLVARPAVADPALSAKHALAMAERAGLVLRLQLVEAVVRQARSRAGNIHVDDAPAPSVRMIELDTRDGESRVPFQKTNSGLQLRNSNMTNTPCRGPPQRRGPKGPPQGGSRKSQPARSG